MTDLEKEAMRHEPPEDYQMGTLNPEIARADGSRGWRRPLAWFGAALIGFGLWHAFGLWSGLLGVVIYGFIVTYGFAKKQKGLAQLSATQTRIGNKDFIL